MSLPDAMRAALDQIRTIANSRTVFGEPIVAGSVTIIPVSKVSVGFAAGGSVKNNADGSGAGGGIQVLPVAFISIVGEKVSVHAVDKQSVGVDFGKVIAAAPEIIKRVNEFLGKNKKGTTDEA